MRYFLVILTTTVGLVLSGCSKQDTGTEQAATQEHNESGEAKSMMPDVPDSPGTEAVPAPVPETPVEGLAINPYFDEAGGQSELAVARGEQFHLYIMAETVEPHHMQSAQLRLQLPPGVRVLYTVETDRKLTSLGQHDFNYMVVFECTPPGRFIVVSYVCEASADFQGGEITVLPGFLPDNTTFLGFATCEINELRAAGGTATLRLKS